MAVLVRWAVHSTQAIRYMEWAQVCKPGQCTLGTAFEPKSCASWHHALQTAWQQKPFSFQHNHQWCSVTEHSTGVGRLELPWTTRHWC